MLFNYQISIQIKFNIFLDFSPYKERECVCKTTSYRRELCESLKSKKGRTIT